MNWRRTAIASTVTLLVLAIGAGIAVHVLVDPAKVKLMAQQKVRAAWGRELEVGGLDLRLFPWPLVRASRVALASPKWARSANVFEVDRIDANLELMPLFVGKVRVKSLSLEGVKAALEEADDGRQSWALGGSEKSEGTQAPVEASPVEIGSVHVRNVVIHRRLHGMDSEPWLIEDAWADVEPGLRNVQAEAKIRRHGQPLALKARFADLSRLGSQGAVSEGRVELAFAQTHATIVGRLPLERGLQGHDVRIEASSGSLDDVFTFMGYERGKTAPFTLGFASRGTQDDVALGDIAVGLGELKVRGELHVAMRKQPGHVSGHLASSRIDWLKTLRESGGTVKPPRHDEEIFHADPVAWPAIAFLGAIDAQVDIAVDALRLGNGLQLENVKARASLGHGAVDLAPFSVATLGGTAGGALRFDADRKTIRAAFEGERLLLDQWFRERGSKVPFRGGPMKIKASLALSGETFRDLASSVTGPVTIRMGRGTWASPKAGEVEEMMVSALAKKDSADLDFECISGNLDFRRGRSEGKRVLGAKTDVSQLLTGGTVDFRNETLDLRGRVQARKGITVGIATVAGGVQISGKLAKPRIGMDPDEKPALIARAAAAVATAGATIVGEALLSAAARDDPCEAVFR